MEKYLKTQRILDIFTRLSEGKIIHKSEEAVKYGIDERSIQRDIDDMRTYLCNRKVENPTEDREIKYSRKEKGYVMTGLETQLMNNSEILAVSKILLESRAFTKKEIASILDKMIAGCVPVSNMKLVSELIANEKYHYVELHHKSCLQEKMWEIGNNIHNHQMMEITYERGLKNNETVKRIVEPIAIMFSEYYFYLIAFIVEKDKEGRYQHSYDYPAIYRIDRLKKFKPLADHYRITYTDRFEEGEFRKKIQFMYAGKLMTLQLKYTGENPEAVLDRLPTAKVVSETESEWLIEAQVYGKGIIMWLLSQADRVEVLKPEYLREEMKQTLQTMLDQYTD